MNLPEWLDLTKIGAIGIILLAVVQYIKAHLPEKWIWLITIVLGVVISIVSELYIGADPINWIRAIVNGVLAAVIADTGYQFLSGKGNLSLPSKGEGKDDQMKVNIK
ncbi:MAG: hypothetical protein A2Z69_00225 [Bacteroidetes bacterium RBG_13_44_24]|nr:MAG: hypothetical protein A2Z69_00225 [Bacteroidetes bacterium RBG_13_44_24]